MTWPLRQCPPYSPPPYNSTGNFTGTHSANEWNHPFRSLPVKLSLNQSHRPAQSYDPRSFPTVPGNAWGSDSPTFRHVSSQSTLFDWQKFVQYASDIALHQELQWHHAWTPYSLGLRWDVVRPPSTAKALSPRYHVVVPDFNSRALHKPVDRLELWSDHPVLACYMHQLKWGPVPVGGNPTVLELVQSIYDYLSTPLTNDDLRYVYSTPHNVNLLERARKLRVEDGYYAVNDVEHKGPFRRSDVLGSHRCFYGIRAIKVADGKDILLFNLGPGRVPRY